MTNLTNWGTNDVVLSSFDYLLHATGRRTNATEIILQAEDGYVTNSLSWMYDGMYRLTKETRTTTAGTLATDSYGYDPVGNRLSKKTVVGSTTNVSGKGASSWAGGMVAIG